MATEVLSVGLTGRLAVDVEGVVTGVGPHSVVIAGWELPTSLHAGVHTVSTRGLPADGCDREHCGDADCGCEPECYRDHCDIANHGADATDLIHEIERWHADEHAGPFTYCAHPICRTAKEVD